MNLYSFILFVYYISGIVESSKVTKHHEVTIEPIDYGTENYYTAGVKKSIICKGDSINQKVDWIDPSGKVVSRQGSKRVFAQEHFVPSLRSRVPALVLTLTRTLVEDTGVWTCRSGNAHHEVSLCIIEPADFVSTATEVTVDRGRSITLSCQAKGDPEPRIVWYRNGDIISDEANPMKYKVMRKFSKEGFEGLLTITALDSQDSGVYTCGSVQENSELPECTLNKHLNITLHVNYPPFFDSENETALVPGKENESVDLICSADGYPVPTYRWFKDTGDLLTEYSKDEARKKEDKSVLAVTANESTFGQRFICRATNHFGVVEKTFEIYKMGPPEKPSVVREVYVDVFDENVSENDVGIKITWSDLVKFPIDEIQVQYKECRESSGTDGGDFDFSDSKTMIIRDIVFEKNSQIFDSVVLTALTDLNDETDYCIRVRATNAVGVSPWSDVEVASTMKAEVEPLVDQKAESVQSNTTFYGIFFGCAIAIVAVAYMFAIRLV